MSTVPATTGGGVALPEEDAFTGLEDFDTTDMVMPRLGIDHKEAKFVDNLSGQRFDDLTVILLGLVKQRILWDADVDEGDKPLCKSLEFHNGHPDDKRFPWKQSGFDRTSIPVNENEGIVLPCASCPLKDWGTHPNGKTPWCSEQHTFPLLMQVGDGFAPALFTVQRTGIKPSKTYLTSFARSKTPTYTVFTKLSLRPEKKGTVFYAVPVFVQADGTPQEDWPVYAQHYRQIREFITTPRRLDDDEAAAGSAGTATGAESPAPAPAAPAPPPPEDDDLPW